MVTTEGLLLHPPLVAPNPPSLPPSLSPLALLSPPLPHPPRMAYLFACGALVRAFRARTRICGCARAHTYCNGVRACPACVCASMPVVPNPLTRARGNVLSLKTRDRVEFGPACQGDFQLAALRRRRDPRRVIRYPISIASRFEERSRVGA